MHGVFSYNTVHVAPLPQDLKRMLGYQDLTNTYRVLNQNKAYFQEI